MRIAIAQINPTLGDFEANLKKILNGVREAADKKCSLVLFSECALFGYHPFDLLERTAIVEQQLKAFAQLSAKIPEGIAVVVGLISKNPSKLGRPYHNSAALLIKGKKPKLFHKTLLPTGDVFDEARFIEAGDVSKNFFSWKGRKFLLTICEDIWAWPDRKGRSSYKVNPLKAIKGQKIDAVLNLSASPWFPGKIELRREVVAQTARHFKAPVFYANMVGGQDEIIFDGRSFVTDAKGVVRAESLPFDEQLNVIDLNELDSWSVNAKLSEMEELRRGLVLGIRDFCRKVGLSKVHLGLSGGIDSALVACLAVDALGPGQVSAFAMPGPYSSPESFELARVLAKNLGISFRSIEIGSLYEASSALLKEKVGIEGFGVVHENLQSRLRGLMMMAVSNAQGSLLLTTGNKSEYATGYATLYGDMCGGLAPIGDLTKDQVYALSREYNRDGELVPNGILDRAPSAELRPDQRDQDTLPPYDDLDASVRRIVENCLENKTDTDRWLSNHLFRTEFKRWQAAPILKASAHSFGRGRRFPLAHRASEVPQSPLKK